MSFPERSFLIEWRNRKRNVTDSQRGEILICHSSRLDSFAVKQKFHICGSVNNELTKNCVYNFCGNEFLGENTKSTTTHMNFIIMGLIKMGEKSVVAQRTFSLALDIFSSYFPMVLENIKLKKL